MAEVTAQRDAALAQRAIRRAEANKIVRLDHADIERLVGTLDDARQAIREADPAIKGDVYRRLRMKLTYHPGQNKIRAEAFPDPDSCGVMVRVRGGS